MLVSSVSLCSVFCIIVLLGFNALIPCFLWEVVGYFFFLIKITHYELKKENKLTWEESVLIIYKMVSISINLLAFSYTQ